MHLLGLSLETLLQGQPLVIIFGAMADKDIESMLAGLQAMNPDRVIFTAAGAAGLRAAPPPELLARWPFRGESVSPAAAALARARELAGPQGNVLVCGSIYLVGEVREPGP
jgi:dihydrofolate synthase/folylpolyglutamate synthase